MDLEDPIKKALALVPNMPGDDDEDDGEDDDEFDNDENDALRARMDSDILIVDDKRMQEEFDNKDY